MLTYPGLVWLTFQRGASLQTQQLAKSPQGCFDMFIDPKSNGCVRNWAAGFSPCFHLAVAQKTGTKMEPW